MSWHRDPQGTIVLIRLPWRGNAPYLLLGSVVWLGALWQLGYARAPGAVGALLCLPVLVALYVAAVGWLNRWIVNFDAELLSVRMGPLPWKRSTSLPTSQLSGLGLDKTEGRGGAASTYIVEARTGDGRTRPLLGGLHKPAAVRVLDILTTNFPRQAGETHAESTSAQ